MTAYPQVPLDHVLIEDRDEVRIRPDETYRTAGIYSFGRGLFDRDQILGSETAYKTLFRLHRDQFVLSRLNGWEGAVDIVPESLDGFLVSNEYPTFSVRSDRALPGYLHWIARWSGFWERLIPRGSMVRRKRVQVEQLLAVEIPLPPLDEQQLITEKLDLVDRGMSRVSRAQESAGELGEAAVEAAAWDVFSSGVAAGWPTSPLGAAADINPTRDRLPADARVDWVPMAAVDERDGTIVPEERDLSEVRKGYKQFRRGDVLFARITPSMQNGKCAIFAGPREHGYGSTEFHVIRPKDELLARWIHRFLRTREVRDAAAKHFTGTAGQQRVPAGYLERLTIPVPAEAEQLEALQRIDRIVGSGNKFRQRRGVASGLSKAVMPALLNQTFSSGDRAGEVAPSPIA